MEKLERFVRRLNNHIPMRIFGLLSISFGIVGDTIAYFMYPGYDFTKNAVSALCDGIRDTILLKMLLVLYVMVMEGMLFKRELFFREFLLFFGRFIWDLHLIVRKLVKNSKNFPSL
jgi:hypothetical protein